MEEHPENKELDTKEVVSRLLSARRITRVIYVDEDFDSRGYVENLIEYIREHHSDEGFAFASEDPEIAKQMFMQWWAENLDESARMVRIKEWSIKRSKNNTEQQLLNLVDENVLECLSPDSFNSLNIKNGFDESHQVLVLMDQELEGYEKGMSLLRTYNDCDHIQCGLFSGTFDKEEEIEKWRDLCDYSKYIYPISKKRVTEGNSNDIIEGLRNVLWLRQISKIKGLYSETLSNALKETSFYVDQIDPASFDNIVMTKSETEGCWEFDTLHRIGLVTLGNYVKEQLTNNQAFDNFQTSTSLLRTIKSVVSGNIPKSSTKLVYEITNIEKFDNEKYINHIYSQLCNGDIFKIGDKYYMLLCQPCNLEIRPDGKRSNNSEQCYLIPMEKEKPDAESNYQYCRVIKDFEVDTNYCLRYNRAELHSIRILDLVSYNQDGSAIIDFSNDNLENKAIQANQTKRYNSISRYLKKYLEGLKSIRQSDVKTPLAGNFSLVEKMFTNPDCKGAFIKKPTIDIDNNKVDFNIHRVGRLKDPWAQEYLQEFMAYLSRPAYPMNLG